MQEKEKEEILNQLDAQMEVIEGLDLESILDYDKMILDLMLTPVLILDSKQQVVYGNKEFLRFSGAKKRSISKKDHCSKLVNFPDGVWDQITNNTSRVRLVDVKGKSSDSQSLDLWANILSLPIRGDDKSFMGVFIIFQDKTVEVILHNHYKNQIDKEREQLQKLKAAYEKLQEMDRLKSNLLAIVSHEMRTPLAVQGYTLEAFTDYLPALGKEIKSIANKFDELGESKNKSVSKIAKYLEKVEKGSQRLDNNLRKMNQIVDNILDMRQLSQGKMVLNYQKVNVPDFFDQIGQNFQILTKRNKTEEQELVLDLEEGFSTMIVDPIRLEQVFVNIIGNALRYNPDNGKIVVGASVEEEDIRFYVGDEGVGIPEAERMKIFNSFYSLDSAEHHTRKSGTLGLGLAICKAIVESHGGHIKVEDHFPGEENPGTIFDFTISKLNELPKVRNM